ncbi:C39 family peptidase, partial [Patescibacteria group bacterium]|nr:C39 family peptidase [Patescibacteria group bacterium]
MNKTRLGMIGMILVLVIIWFFVWKASLNQVSIDPDFSLPGEIVIEEVVQEEVSIQEVPQEEVPQEEVPLRTMPKQEPPKVITETEVKSKQEPVNLEIETEQNQAEDIIVDSSLQEDESVLTTDIPKQVLLNVPFAPQAPFGDWDDIRKQNACEEISIIMAMRWVEGKDMTFLQAEQEILAMVDFEQETYGHFHDTSVDETVTLFKDYFKYDRVFVKYDIDYEDIKQELAKGNLIIVPADGTKLGNPYFVPPGPIEHMLVVLGYDDATQEFITNVYALILFMAIGA